MAKKSLHTATTSALVEQACALIEQARMQAVRQTNTLMLFSYFHMGRLIVEHEQGGEMKAVYGKSTLTKLSKKLTEQFGAGFSVDNLQNMRLFYSIYKERFDSIKIYETASRKSEKPSLKRAHATKAEIYPIYETASRKLFQDQFPLAWSSYVVLCKIKVQNERSFYEIEATQGHWSTRELQRQINAGLFERLVLSKNKKEVKLLAQKGQIVERPEDALKSNYVLEFLGLETKPSYTESDLERAIIDKLEQFLLEMGKGFLFQGRQVQFSFDDERFFVDLVLYNRLLQCFVLVDLKIGKLKHQDIGQMQMYVNYYDRFIKADHEKPTIGIIICKDKSEAVIEITLPKDNKTIFAKEYKLYLPTKAELKRIL
jgi:predicted nuclease of restriction endonuclease-like (RecB) superfamily